MGMQGVAIGCSAIDFARSHLDLLTPVKKGRRSFASSRRGLCVRSQTLTSAPPEP
jgi:hypothetical protein